MGLESNHWHEIELVEFCFFFFYSSSWLCRCPRIRWCGRWCSWSRFPGRRLERFSGGFSRTLLQLAVLLVQQVIPSPIPCAMPCAIRDCNCRPAKQDLGRAAPAICSFILSCRGLNRSSGPCLERRHIHMQAMQQAVKTWREYAVDDRECAVLPLPLPLEGSRAGRDGRCWLAAGFVIWSDDDPVFLYDVCIVVVNS